MTQFNDTFLRACRNEPTEYIPVWFMRQAGRSLPGYRKLRLSHGVLELTQIPELAAQVSLEPIKLLGVDAAILFADIMLLPLAMGIDLEIIDAVGPVVHEPITSAKGIDRLKPLEAGKVAYLSDTIRILRGELKVPLIGFSAAPFTLASYLIEGKPTRTWQKTKQLMIDQPDMWNHLMTVLSDGIIDYLTCQIEAGAQALQLFDSWAGSLSAADYREFVLPHTARIFSALGGTVPRIHFGTDTAALMNDFASVDCEVIGLDWRVDIGRVRPQLGGRAVQGNLDPVTLLTGTSQVERRAQAVIDSAGDRQGFIFNLGHGVLPESPDLVLKHLVDFVHSA